VVRDAAKQTQTTLPKGKSIDELLGGTADSTRKAAPDTTGKKPW
jgi:hypothetical protein